MISICGTIINAKYDIQMMVEALHRHNKGTDFEICMTHDDRVDDGSKDLFDTLRKKYDNLVFASNTHQDTVDYLEKLISHYETRGIFREILPGLKDNLLKFEKKELFDHSETFLWLSSGMMYNKAVSVSSGDKLLIGPGDFAYMFRLKELDDYISSHSKNGHFYGKPHAIWARMTNQDKAWLERGVDEVHKGALSNSPDRWDNRNMFKDYLKYPPQLEDFYIPDFRNNKLISWASEDCMNDLKTYCIESITKGGVQHIKGFHGVHTMTRKTYDAIGGFTEEFYGRASADDKMTALGRKFSQGSLPPQFSFAWTVPGEIIPDKGQGYPEDWEELLKAKDPFYETHPIPPHDALVYLHAGVVSDGDMLKLSSSAFNKSSPPLRVVT